MKITNEIIASKFNELADLLEIQNANPFRVRAYRNAARSILSLGKRLSEMIASGVDLTEIPGIGQDLAEKIREIAESGELSLLIKTQKKVPHFLSDLMQVEGLGPKRIKILYEKLTIKSVDDLKKAIDEGRVEELKGFGPTISQKIKKALERASEYAQKFRLFDTWNMAELLFVYLKSSSDIRQVDIAGSFRRRKELIGDLDILASSKKPANAIKHFLSFEHIETMSAQGPTKVSVRLHTGLQVDFRVVSESSYGAALLYFTGSKAHNVAIRKLAVGKKLKLNEYGLFKGKKNIAGRTEADVYGNFGLPYIEPELREDRGEIEAARAKTLPELITQKNLKGDLHVHTKETDGKESLQAMVQKAQDLGYEYVAITDHSRHLTVAKGLDRTRLLAQIKKIDKLNEKLDSITILKSIECDILEKGKLDLPDSILKELDLTVCSVHSRFNLSSKEQTERVIRAMDNKYFNILAHPTGRLINRRPAFEIDIEKVMEAALERGCFLELNSHPERLDLNDIYCKMAKDMGLKLALSTDAHSAHEFDLIKFGIFQARRGWLSKEDIINTKSLSRLRKLLKRF